MNGPIFVVGMNGSGTTMMLDHLNSHSQIYGFREETRILPSFLRTLGSYGDLEEERNFERLWTDMCKAFPFWRANSDAPVPRPSNWREYERTPCAIFDYVLTYFANQEGKPIWCEKTPMHALHMLDLARGFPRAKFVHMIRDGRDCAASFRRRWGYNPRVTVFRWKRTISAAQAQAKQLAENRYTEVRFEELTTDPEQVLKRLLGFLELDFESNVLMSRRSSARVRGIDSSRPTPNSGAFRAYFSEKENARLEAIAGRQLSALGYEVNNPNGDNDLARFFVAIHQLRTYVARLRDVARRARNSRSPLKLFLGRIRSGLGHIRSNRY